MDLADALTILSTLADGHDPLTGRALDAGHLSQQPQVVRALCLAVHELRQRSASAPAHQGHTQNAGKPWSAREEAELVQAFDDGATLDQLAVKHGRTRQAIHGRLYRLGKMPPWRPEARSVQYPSRPEDRP